VGEWRDPHHRAKWCGRRRPDASTRRATKKLAAIARLRRPRVVVIDETPETGLRRLVEGDVGSELQKKLRQDGIDVEVVPAAP